MQRTVSSKQIQQPTTQPDIETIAKMISSIVAQSQQPIQVSKPNPPEPTVVNSEPQSKPTAVKPKKQLTEKQLASLAAGRAKNSRFKPRNV